MEYKFITGCIKELKIDGYDLEICLSYCYGKDFKKGYYIELTPLKMIDSKRVKLKELTTKHYQGFILKRSTQKDFKMAEKYLDIADDYIFNMIGLIKDNEKKDCKNTIKDAVDIFNDPTIEIRANHNDFIPLFKKKNSKTNKEENLLLMRSTALKEKEQLEFRDKKIDKKEFLAKVAGHNEVKEQLLEILDFKLNPEKYKKMGAKMPKGILFFGPPGNGKTLIAKELSTSCNMAFINCSGSEFTEKFVGVGAKRVRELFAKARKEAPAIVFIDEVDAIGGKRGNDLNSERDQTLNQLLVELDGFKDDDDIMLICTTNREDMLDDALKRAGRLDRHIYIGSPSLLSRKELFEVHTKGKPLDKGVDFDILARKTHGCSGADIANISNEASLLAVKNEHDKIMLKDFELAFENIIAGMPDKNIKLIQAEKKITSYHEAGHEAARILIEKKKSEKISIIPTSKSLGRVIQYPEEDRFLATKKELNNKIKVLLAGRVSEEIMLGESTSGCSDDLSKASEIALNMVRDYGMNDEGSLFTIRTKSSYLNDLDIERADKLLIEAFKEVKELFIKNKDLIDCIANILLDNEEISGVDLGNILSRRFNNIK